MRWFRSHCCAPRGRALADRHYPRRSPGAVRFVAPGSPLVLVTEDGLAVWVTLRQRAEFVDHQWPGAWCCTLFRNEGPALSSQLIREALAASVAELGRPPSQGLVTFVDPAAVRHKRDPGRCFRRAGFEEWGRLEPSHGRGARVVLGVLPGAFPPPEPARGGQLLLPAMPGPGQGIFAGSAAAVSDRSGGRW